MFKRGTGSPGGGRGEAAPSGRRAACVAAAMAAALLGGRASAAETCASVVGRLASVEGVVQVRGEADADWRAAELGGELCRQDTVRTGALSRAAIALVTDEILRLDQDTTVRLAEVPLEASEPSVLDLVFGALQSFSRSPRRVDVGTPHMTLAIRGTEFVVRAGQGESVLTVTEGEVVASNAQGELAVPGGQSAVARPGQAPQPYLLVRPQDAVQWSLYYPPILSLAPGPGAPPELEEALAPGRRGDVAAALASLDRLPDRGRGAQAQLYRAALLLSVGRVDEARAAIDVALAADPRAGLAYAQRAVINVAQNNKEEALTDARRGIELAPDSAAARIALSYAQQASFDIQGARDTMLQATADQPDDALAWARLSEVWLMLGYRDRSREAAERAAALAPDFERVQTVRGFADLVEFRTGPAKAAFERAIALNSADPLPRFGLGLARIRDGALDQGREEIEVAVGLDPGNALLRTYLGRAYFEERRAEISGDQYRLAKDLDPLDPTVYLYDAIRLQTINRPVEALDQLERSIELNGNRAVYRSQLLLDQDRAARGASLSRIYQDLERVMNQHLSA
jgi:tetratricopeptide (TPR) repeat protein